MTQTIVLDGTTLPGVTKFQETKILLKTIVRSKGAYTSKLWVSTQYRSFRLSWEGVTPAELSIIRAKAVLLAKKVLVFRHPSEMYSAALAEFPVTANPRGTLLSYDAIQAWTQAGDGPLLFSVSLDFISQRPDINATFSTINFPG